MDNSIKIVHFVNFYSLEHFFEGGDHIFGTVEDFADACGDHVGRGGDDLVFGIDADIGGFAALWLATQLGGNLRGLVFGSAEGDLDAVAAQDLGQHHGCDAHGHNGLAGTVSGEQCVGHAVDDGHLGAVEGKGGEVAGCTHAAGKGEAVVVGRHVVVDGQQFATGYAGGLHEDVALLGIFQAHLLFVFLLGQVYMRNDLEHAFGGEALILPPFTVDGEHKGEAFLQFAAVAVTAATEYNSYFFHGVNVGDSRKAKGLSPYEPCPFCLYCST